MNSSRFVVPPRVMDKVGLPNLALDSTRIGYPERIDRCFIYRRTKLCWLHVVVHPSPSVLMISFLVQFLVTITLF